jgi:hypothetical protein
MVGLLLLVALYLPLLAVAAAFCADLVATGARRRRKGRGRLKMEARFAAEKKKNIPLSCRKRFSGCTLRR